MLLPPPAGPGALRHLRWLPRPDGRPNDGLPRSPHLLRETHLVTHSRTASSLFGLCVPFSQSSTRLPAPRRLEHFGTPTWGARLSRCERSAVPSARLYAAAGGCRSHGPVEWWPSPRSLYPTDSESSV